MAINPVKQRRQDTTKTKSVPVSQDLIYQAKQMFPGYDDSMAMALYVMDKAARQQETDTQQNKLIQTQKAQNDKLTGVVKSLGQELHDFEQQSLETDREVERLKDLSAKLRPAGELQQQAAKASREELEKLEAKLNSIKSVPGIDQQKFTELSKQVDQMKNMKSVDDKDVQRIENILSSLQGKQGASDELFNKAMSELNQTREKLDAKEERFKAYIEKKSGEVKNVQKSSAEELKKYSDIVAGYKKDVDNFSTQMRNELDIARNIRGEIQQDAEDMDRLIKYIRNIIPDSKGIVREPSQPKQQQTSQLPNQEQSGYNSLSQQEWENMTPEEQKAWMDAQQALSQYTEPTGTMPGNYKGKYSQTNESKLYEDIHLTRMYRNPMYEKWLQAHIKLFVVVFKRRYKGLLASKHPTYSDQQIAEKCEDHSPYFWHVNPDGGEITDEQMNNYLAAVRLDLWREEPEGVQGELPLSEGIGNIFENMVNQIYKKL
jgi:hypothetical protein